MRTWKWTTWILLAVVLMAACGSNESSDNNKAQVRRVGELSTLTPSPAPATQTPTPTPYPSEIPQPTPRSVTVTRITNLDAGARLAKGEIVPPIELTSIDGNVYTLDELEGRVVIVNFWTLGCGSCFYEFPFFQEIDTQLDDSELLIFGVNVSDLSDQTRTLGETLGIEFPLFVDPQGEVFATHFGGAVVPTTYFIDQEGVVFDVVIGPLDMYNLSVRLNELGLDIEIPTAYTP